MPNSLKNNYVFQLKGTLTTAGTAVYISEDLERNLPVAFTDAYIVMRNRRGNLIERCRGTAAAGTLTLSLRGLDQSDADVEVSALKKQRNDGTVVYVTILSVQLVDRQEDNIFAGTQNFYNIYVSNNGTFAKELRIPAFVNSAARDLAIPTPVDGMIVNTAGDLQHYNGFTAQWETAASGTPTPNASTTVAGKVEIATSAESIAGTDVGGTGAFNSVLPSDIAKNIQSSTFISGADVGGDDTYVVALTPVLAAYTTSQQLFFKATTANTGACSVNFGPSVLNIKTQDGNDPQTGVIRAGMVVSGHYDGTNFVLDTPDFATSTNRGTTEYATDAETITGTSTTLAVTPASYKAAVTQALVGGNFDAQYDIIFYPNGATSVLNSSAANNFSGSGTAGNILYFNVASDAYINAQLGGKPNTANSFLRWDDITTIEIEFNAVFLSPGASRYFSVGLADTSATTGWTDITSVQRRVFLQAGNNTATTVFVRTADGTTTSASSAITATYTNWNTYKMTFNKGTNVLTYLNGTLVDTKVTNLPSGTNLVNVGVGLDSISAEDMYLGPITVRVKYA